jgi:hypothetical protein
MPRSPHGAAGLAQTRPEAAKRRRYCAGDIITLRRDSRLKKLASL